MSGVLSDRCDTAATVLKFPGREKSQIVGYRISFESFAVLTPHQRWTLPTKCYPPAHGERDKKPADPAVNTTGDTRDNKG